MPPAISHCATRFTAVPGTPWCIVSGGALVLWGDGPLAMRIPAVAFVAESTFIRPPNPNFQNRKDLVCARKPNQVGTKHKVGTKNVLCKKAWNQNLEPKNCGMAAVRLLKVPVRITQGPSTNTPCSAAGPSVFCLVTKRRQPWRCSWATHHE